MSDELRDKLAEKYANSTPKIEKSAPRTVSNPGLYFGYLAGYDARDAEVVKLTEDNAYMVAALAFECCALTVQLTEANETNRGLEFEINDLRTSLAEARRVLKEREK